MFIYWKIFFKDCFSIIRSIFIVALQAFSKRETQMYPDVPCIPASRYRGRIVLTSDLDGNERCVACGLCAVACPVDCIALKKGERENGRWYPEFFRINFSRCIFCGMCEESCPTGAIQLTQDFNMNECNRSDLIYEKVDLLINEAGKYPEYDFYQVSGVSLEGKNNSFSKRASTDPIDVKTIMP
ncbi:NADH-quinone oxidoreductase subunit I [Blochmannia endosymbiont of Polyrhachis (Hedomyrma) turneri]|nr:NADH-quinone oxidoreductase subunit I [Blochmannia endosymbiont of Polyrhachis (Hedomyrma) turneri]